MPLIGVIIPVYNVEKYLEQCVDSVLNQSFKDIEIILVDDGSKDSSGEICDYYKEKDSRVKVIHKENGGLSDARNMGIRQCSSEYILFLDSDDYWKENCLEEIARCIEDNVDIVFLTAAKYFEQTGQIEEKFETLDKDKVKNKSKREVFEYLASSEKFPVSACTKLIKKELIINNNLYFEKGLLSEDIDWSTRLLLAAEKFDVCYAEFYIYRKQREGSITNGIKLKSVQDLLYIIKKWAYKCKKKEIDLDVIDSLLSLLSYEYSILLAHLFSINKQERKIVFDEIKELKWILRYSNSKKTKLVKLVTNFCGLNFSAALLNKYIIVSNK